MATKTKRKVKKHIQVYWDAFGYDLEDATTFVPSEIDNAKAVDVHHIKGREDRIENLMALTRDQHIFYGDKQRWYHLLYVKHYNFLVSYGVDFDHEYLLTRIKRYGP